MIILMILCPCVGTNNSLTVMIVSVRLSLMLVVLLLMLFAVYYLFTVKTDVSYGIVH